MVSAQPSPFDFVRSEVAIQQYVSAQHNLVARCSLSTPACCCWG